MFRCSMCDLLFDWGQLHVVNELNFCGSCASYMHEKKKQKNQCSIYDELEAKVDLEEKPVKKKKKK